MNYLARNVIIAMGPAITGPNYQVEFNTIELIYGVVTGNLERKNVTNNQIIDKLSK